MPSLSSCHIHYRNLFRILLQQPSNIAVQTGSDFEYTGSDWIQCFPTSDPVI